MPQVRTPINECELLFMEVISINKYYVYGLYIEGDENPFYIGKGSGRRYKRLTCMRNSSCMKIISENECVSKILIDNLNEDDAYNKEIELIKYYSDLGVNLTNRAKGGKGNNGWIPDDEFRNKIRSIVSGENNPNYGNKWTEEQKAALSEKRKMNAKSKGKNNPRSKRVMCVETGKIYDYQQQASEELGLSSMASIIHALKKPHFKAGNFHFVKEDCFDLLDTKEKREKYLYNISHNKSPYTGMCTE